MAYPPPHLFPYHVSYHPPFYHPFSTQFDPSVSLANPYIYDPTQVKHRRRTTPEQLKVLEDTFKTDPKPSPALRRQLSAQLAMSPRVLQVWFQNRRMKVKRLAKKQTTAGQRDASVDPDDTPSESPHPPPASPPPPPPPPTTASSDPSTSESPSPPPDSLPRRVSLPDTRPAHPDGPVPPTFDALVDPALKPRRSLTSLHRLESHPSISFIASSNIPSRTAFASIVPPSLPPSFRSFHHHSPSTPLTRISSSQSPIHHRPASFHVIPPEQHHHLAATAAAPPPYPPTLLHQPYSFPPRPLPVPGPGPLPAADYSFGSPAYRAVGDDDTDATSSEYTDHGYRSRFGSFASVVESEEGTTASEWEVSAVTSAADVDGRRPSWTGEVAEMLSGLDVNGKPEGGPTSAPPRPRPPPSNSAHSSFDANHTLWESAPGPEDETTPPATYTHQRPSLPISQSSELAFALSSAPSPDKVAPSPGTQYSSHAPSPASAHPQHHYPSPVQNQSVQYPQGSDDPLRQQQQQQQQQLQQQQAAYPSTNLAHPASSCSDPDDMLELHHALAGYAEHPNITGDGSIYFATDGSTGYGGVYGF